MFYITKASGSLTKKYDTSKKIKEAIMKRITPKVNEVLELRDTLYNKVTIRELFY